MSTPNETESVAAESREIRVGPDVVVVIAPNGDFGSIRHRMHGAPRRSELVRVAGAGEPVFPLRMNGMPWLKVWMDAKRRVATLQVV